MGEIADTEYLDDSDSNTESVDFFPNRKLSEVVAQILESDLAMFEKDDKNEKDTFEVPDGIRTAFIDYNEEPKNKGLFREPLPSIEESDLEETFACEYDEFASKGLKNSVSGNQTASHDEFLASQLEVTGDNFLSDTANDYHKKTSNDYNEHISDCFDQHIRTIIGERTETIFDVTSPQINGERYDGIKCRNETEFGVNVEYNDHRYRWSVTSV